MAAVAIEFDADHQALPANVFYCVELSNALAKAGHNLLAPGGGVFTQLFGFNGFIHGERSGAAQRVAAEGGAVLAGLQEYQFQKDSGAQLERDDLVDGVRRAIQRASALTAADLKKGMASLATIGATAVFVGLLATTIGVINAFGAIGTTGSSGLGAVSSGISEALVGTAVGLLVAIPAVWFYNYLTGRLEFFNVEMDNSSSELVDYFIRLEL